MELSRVSHFDSSFLQKQLNLPTQFIWEDEDLIRADDELNEPVIDLKGFLKGDKDETAHAAELVRAACLKHGFFQVINHGVDANILRDALEENDTIFKLPIDKKLTVGKKPAGSVYGYAIAHSDRFSSKLPWKETFSFGYNAKDSKPVVVDYFKHVLGEEFERTGLIYQRYCEEMMKLSLVIFELLAISLGIDRFHYRKYFEDASSIMRCNYYPSCNNPSLTLGTGPHCDPMCLTILHQDEVGGLDVFADNKWHGIRPLPGALAINIGDTFMALTNGRYKSCVHRAMVNSERERMSIAFFVCPKDDKVVKPVEALVCGESGNKRKYPDFTWSDLLGFTQNHYRADVATLQAFTRWFQSSKPSH